MIQKTYIRIQYHVVASVAATQSRSWYSWTGGGELGSLTLTSGYGIGGLRSYGGDGTTQRELIKIKTNETYVRGGLEIEIRIESQYFFEGA